MQGTRVIQARQWKKGKSIVRETWALQQQKTSTRSLSQEPAGNRQARHQLWRALPPGDWNERLHALLTDSTSSGWSAWGESPAEPPKPGWLQGCSTAPPGHRVGRRSSTSGSVPADSAPRPPPPAPPARESRPGAPLPPVNRLWDRCQRLLRGATSASHTDQICSLPDGSAFLLAPGEGNSEGEGIVHGGAPLAASTLGAASVMHRPLRTRHSPDTAARLYTG